MSLPNLEGLIHLNNHEILLNDIQNDIDRAREKYFDVGHIQLELDRRQTSLDAQKKRVMEAKSLFVNPN